MKRKTMFTLIALARVGTSFAAALVAVVIREKFGFWPAAIPRVIAICVVLDTLLWMCEVPWLGDDK